MKKYKLEFKELGRKNATGEVIVDNLEYETIYRVVKPHLCSSDLSFDLQENEWGCVYGLFGKLGLIKYTVVNC